MPGAKNFNKTRLDKRSHNSQFKQQQKTSGQASIQTCNQR